MKKLETILVILDKPKHAQTALARARDIAQAVGARMHLVSFAWLAMAEEKDVFDAHQRRAMKKAVVDERKTWVRQLVVDSKLAAADVIVTCTPSTAPLLKSEWIRPGTHITAIGSDTAEKQELDAAILTRAGRVVVDSLSQSELRGEVFRAVRAGAIGRERLIELGRVIEDPALRRASDDEITVADLTGVAVQDIQISAAVWERVK